jgi:parallel beta-helix repeat protein
VIQGNTVTGTGSSPIKCDDGSHRNTISGNITEGIGTATDGAITLYRSDGCVINGNVSKNAAIGLWLQESSGTQVSTLRTETCPVGVSIVSSDRTRVASLTCVGATTTDAKVTNSTDVLVIAGRASPLIRFYGNLQARAESQRVMYSRTTTTTPTLMTDGTGSGVKVFETLDSTSLRFQARVVARSSGGNSAAFSVSGLLKRGTGAATTAIVGQTTVVDFADAGATWAVVGAVVATVDTSIGALQLQVTGPASQIDWAADVSAIRFGL